MSFSSSKLRLLGVGALFLFYACGTADEPNPRVGETGQIKFSGGGGCNNSTTLALGSSARLTMERADGAALPSGLLVSSTNNSAITVAPGTQHNSVKVTAIEQGEAYLEVTDKGQAYDRVRFFVEPAASVELDRPATRVFAGGTYVLKLGEVYGDCGKDCPLIGGGFMTWRSSPPGALTLVSDVERSVTFTAGKAVDNYTLNGHNKSGGKMLVLHQVSAIDPKDCGQLSAEAVVALPRKPGEELKVNDPHQLSQGVPAGSLLMLRVKAATTSKETVPVWGRDIAWTVEGDAGVVKLFAMGGDPAPAEGPIYSAAAAGKATLVGQVALLGKTIRVPITVTAAK